MPVIIHNDMIVWARVRSALPALVRIQQGLIGPGFGFGLVLGLGLGLGSGLPSGVVPTLARILGYPNPIPTSNSNLNPNPNYDLRFRNF